MKLVVLVDNNTYIDQYYCGEPAVSYYIEDEDTKLLFDVGYSSLFLENMNKLCIDINNINTIAISHGHNDHTGGLKYLFERNNEGNISIIAHPSTFREKSFESEKIGSPLSQMELSKKSNLILMKEPMKINRNITFLGEIPQINNYEPREKIGKTAKDGVVADDFVLDDSALVYKGKNGIYIITGCSHSGICNIIEYAKEMTHCNTVIGVIGGFHLFEITKKVRRTIEYLKNNNIRELYPCHCTSFIVKAAINNIIPIKEVGVGLTLHWE